jgi:hypothetical protein
VRQEEVLGDPHWLDSRWAEKDRALAHFGRTQQLMGHGHHPNANARGGPNAGLSGAGGSVDDKPWMTGVGPYMWLMAVCDTGTRS